MDVRLVRLGKRKIVRGINTLLGRGGEKMKINGSSVNGNSGAKAGVNGDSASS